MRGILVQSLVSRGVPFETALDVASRVRDCIVDRGKVSLEELAACVHEQLGDGLVLEEPLYRAAGPPIVVVESDGVEAPFSKGILAVSLQGAGMDPSDAYDVTRALESQMLQEGVRRIGRAELRARVVDTIGRTHGELAQQGYQIWHATMEAGKPLFLLIGGSSGVGKTSIAVEAARRLEIAHLLRTDSIRQIMRLMFSVDLMPEIHGSTFEVYKVLSVEGGRSMPLIAAFREQAKKVAVGVHALLDRAVEENTPMIIEGVNLLPSVLDLERYSEQAHVIFLIVASLDPESYRNRFRTRATKALARAAGHYLEHFSEILTIQDYILEEADWLDVPIIDNVLLDDAVLSVIRSVSSTLRKSLQRTAEHSTPI
jgi:2-phosphoglycerate kinase